MTTLNEIEPKQKLEDKIIEQTLTLSLEVGNLFRKHDKKSSLYYLQLIHNLIEDYVTYPKDEDDLNTGTQISYTNQVEKTLNLLISRVDTTHKKVNVRHIYGLDRVDIVFKIYGTEIPRGSYSGN